MVHAEQNDGDIKGEKESLEEARAGLAKLHKELGKLGDDVAASEVLILRSQWYDKYLTSVPDRLSMR